MSGPIILFLSASFNHTLLLLIAFWQLQNAKELVILGIKFSNVWTFWAGYALLVSPLYFALNVIFYSSFWYGYNVVFPQKAWLVQLIFWFANMLMMFLVAWLYLGELPTKNVFIAAACLAFAALAIFWR